MVSFIHASYIEALEKPGRRRLPVIWRNLNRKRNRRTGKWMAF